MWQKNEGHNEADILQNQFTAYISVAIQRRRTMYILQAIHKQEVEVLIDDPVAGSSYDIFEDIISELPLLMQFENDRLIYALKKLSERERHIFLARVLDEKSFEELANTYGLGYQGVAAVYYRAIRKIRKWMKEDGNEF